MRKPLALLAVLSLLLVGLAAPAGADSDARPFKARVSGDLFWTEDPSCPVTGMRTNFDVTGNATHMGKITMTGSHCTPPGLTYGPSVLTLTAANGDEIELAYGGTCEPFAHLAVGEVFSCTVWTEMVGGTGRFADATVDIGGSTLIKWLGYVPSMPAWWFYEGTIGY